MDVESTPKLAAEDHAQVNSLFEKTSIDDDGTSHASTMYIDPVAQRKLLFKLDMYLSPVMTLIFLTAYLDRANIGNAASAGLITDLGLVGNQFGNAVTLFYVLYVAFELPCSLVLKKFHPQRMIPALMFSWSCVVIGNGFVQNAGQLYACRLLLGAFESGMFPCLCLYLSTFYTPGEQAVRISYLFVASALSGAFGGLFAFALLKMDGIAGLPGWRWLFIIEGCASVLVSIIIYFVLPDNFETARFLSEDDKALMRLRAEVHARYNGKPQFDWAEVKKALTDPKLYISCWSQFMGDTCSFGMSTFMPIIIKGFGYDTVTTQLLTIPVYLWASGAYILVSWMSDRYNSRAAFMLPGVIVTAIGYAVQLAVPQADRGPLYFSIFLIAPGIYIMVGLNCTWLLNSHAGYYKRATAIGVNQSLGNCAGLIIGQIFKDSVNGKYVTGLSVSLGAVLLAGVGHSSLWVLLRHENAKRERLTPEERENAILNGKGGDFHPDYRYAL
ncbi:hypothetical protein V496_06138 [Pseudogymnoascus sp. VKM F-4515 (FW-2607)]|nr:hypothetical protein V496_06138 [Pseudogymnoascus sp. VKM F-4515 (FW-2607)]